MSSEWDILNSLLQLNAEHINRSTRCDNVIRREGEVSGNFGKSVSESFANRSCVARRDPRKRLCGMTVAPRTPTAETTMSNHTEKKGVHTSIERTTSEEGFGRNKSAKSISPIDGNLRYNEYHADEYGQNLEKYSDITFRESEFLHTNTEMMPSNSFTGLLFNGFSMARSSITSVAVNKTVDHSGNLGNRRTSAIADPSISAKSVQMMAISARM